MLGGGRWRTGIGRAAPAPRGASVLAGAYARAMSFDPTVTNPDKYKTIFENDRVRVLEYKDKRNDGVTAPRSSVHRLRGQAKVDESGVARLCPS